MSPCAQGSKYEAKQFLGGFMFYRGLWGIVEKKRETTRIGFRDLGCRVARFLGVLASDDKKKS